VRRYAAVILFLLSPFLMSAAQPQPASSTTAKCVECHSKVTPNIVSDWKLSKHSGAEITCVTCHGDQHSSATDAAKAKIPTPDTCAQCHETQVAQFKKGKHAMAWASMKAMPTIHWQPMAMIEGEKGCGGCHKIGDKSVAEIAELRHNSSGTEFGAAQCDACHTPHLLGRRSPPAAGLRDLPHGLRSSSVGDVFRFEAWRES